MLDRSVQELKDLLTEICTEGNTLYFIISYIHLILFHRLKKFQNNVPNSNLKRLESMIPRLNEASNKIVKTLTPQKGDNQSLNGKRERDPRLGEDPEDLLDLLEMKPVTDGYKKVKTSPSQSDAPDVILVGAAFTIKFICHAEIQSYMPPEKQYRYGYWSSDGKEGALTIKREDFVNFPNQVTLRLSKEHAKITALRNGNNTSYELTDQSVNGIYYLGNRIDGTVKEKPMKLQKNIPFKLKHGDWICLLMKKGSEDPEVLLGFEFLKN